MLFNVFRILLLFGCMALSAIVVVIGWPRISRSPRQVAAVVAIVVAVNLCSFQLALWPTWLQSLVGQTPAMHSKYYWDSLSSMG